MKVDLKLKNASMVNVLTSEIYQTDISVKNGIITGFSRDDTARDVIDCRGKFVTPGFIDGHLHLESIHVMPGEVTPYAARNGITTMVCDPHEIANAAGVQGVRFIMEAASKEPVDYFFMIPSCVPASANETAGAELAAEDIRELSMLPSAIGLAEVMDFPSVVNGDAAMKKKLEVFDGGIIDGHCPGLRGDGLDAYIRAGIGSDHETEELEEGLEKIRKGMYLMIRYGSSTNNSSLLNIINSGNDSRFMIVSDDNSPVDLKNDMFLLHRLRKMIKLTDAMTLIKGLTVNPAEYFRFYDRGIIAPGRKADMLLFDSLDDFRLNEAFKSGKKISFKTSPDRGIQLSGDTMSVNIRTFEPDDFRIPEKTGEVRAIGMNKGSIITDSVKVKPAANGGWLESDPGKDLLKCAVIERYTGKSGFTTGFITGSGLKKGALASTFNHDAHNIFVMGADDGLMAAAVNKLREMGGGYVYVNDDEEIAVPFDIYGVISSLSLESISDKIEEMEDRLRENGIFHHNPLTLISFMSLSVIPRLKITDKGLVEDMMRAELHV